MSDSAKEWVKDIAIAVVVAVAVIQFVKPTIVKQNSMEPNFKSGDYVFISKQSYLFSDPERGDVVIFQSKLKTEDGEDKMLIKRVIGVPGDRIDIKDGKVYINKKELKESYTKDGVTSGSIDGLIVPKDHVFCMGDNRLVSVDSRDPKVGCVSEDDIIGRVFFRLYPFSKIGLIKSPEK